LNPNFKRTAHESVWLSIPNQLMGKNTRLKIYSQNKVCLSILIKLRGNPRHLQLTVYLSNILVIFSKHYNFKLQLFDNLCMWVFDLEGKPLKHLKIKYWTLSGSKSHF